jgi:hypothetical protein
MKIFHLNYVYIVCHIKNLCIMSHCSENIKVRYEIRVKAALYLSDTKRSECSSQVYSVDTQCQV